MLNYPEQYELQREQNYHNINQILDTQFIDIFISRLFLGNNNIMSQKSPQQNSKIKKIGEYSLGKTIGLGTFAVVRQGKHIPTGQKVSIKMLKKSAIEQTRDKINLSREIRILKKIRHPNIAQLLQVLQTNDKIYLVIEYAKNGELFNLITSNKKGRLDQMLAARIFGQLINAVEYMHKIGVAHRDIKPENILLDDDLNVKIIDFGLSSFYQKQQKLKTSCGSPCYAPPEMLLEKAYDPLMADLWSCGVVLYAMACGFLPYQQSNTTVLYQKIQIGQYEQPEHLSPEIKDLLAKLLKFVPTQRATIAQIRCHRFFKKPIPVVSGLLPSQKITLDQSLVRKLNSLGYYGFRSDIENHKYCSVTVAYYLFLYRHLRQKNQSLEDFFKKIQQSQIGSPIRCRSLVLIKSNPRQSYESNSNKIIFVRQAAKQLVNNQQETQLLDRLIRKNKGKMRKQSQSIRIRRVL